jgi:hypothetical protein
LQHNYVNTSTIALPHYVKKKGALHSIKVTFSSNLVPSRLAIIIIKHAAKGSNGQTYSVLSNSSGNKLNGEATSILASL